MLKRRKVYKRFARVALGIVAALTVAPSGASAQTAGLAPARSSLQLFNAELTTVVPIAATIALVILGVAYALDMVQKGTLMRFGLGIIIAGSAVGIVGLLF